MEKIPYEASMSRDSRVRVAILARELEVFDNFVRKEIDP